MITLETVNSRLAEVNRDIKGMEAQHKITYMEFPTVTIWEVSRDYQIAQEERCYLQWLSQELSEGRIPEGLAEDEYRDRYVFAIF